jgi:hypothetical protein
MVAVSVCIPWGDSGCEHRRAALGHVMAWYRQHHPWWQLIVSDPAAAAQPWCKAAAAADAIASAAGDTIVVADADVLCDGIGAAVDAVVSGRHPWAVPHHGVYRLTPEATACVYAGGEAPDARLPRSLLRGRITESHRGVVGGGLVVLRRALWDRVPLDARFRGWGQEDLAWGWALARVAGPPWRGMAPLYHLWHPPAQRADRARGSADSVHLWDRYRRSYTGDEVLALLAEPGARL